MQLQETYTKEIAPKLAGELGTKNVMAVPRLEKIVVNMGISSSIQDKKIFEEAALQVGQITGQKPVVTRARKAIASFKLREGDPVGVSVTLRGARMYDFFERFVNITLPRVKDFHGVPNSSFDGKGNYALGFADMTMFPEIDAGNMGRIKGLQIIFKTTAKDNEGGHKLLQLLGMPFEKEKKAQ